MNGQRETSGQRVTSGLREMSDLREKSDLHESGQTWSGLETRMIRVNPASPTAASAISSHSLTRLSSLTAQSSPISNDVIHDF